MDRGAWRATVSGVAGIEHDLPYRRVQGRASGSRCDSGSQNTGILFKAMCLDHTMMGVGREESLH